jgi:hypothetical protein
MVFTPAANAVDVAVEVEVKDTTWLVPQETDAAKAFEPYANKLGEKAND